MKTPGSRIRKIGKYVLLETIGTGGFSTVHVCRHEETGAEVAVKIGQASVWEEYVESEGLEGMMHMDEWNAYKRLNYGRGEANASGVPTVYETGLIKLSEQEIYPYLVIQLLGRNVGGLSTETSTNNAYFAWIARNMLSVLVYMHSKGLVHRDVKPSNFCVGRSSQESAVYILDMGFAVQRPKEGDCPHDDFVGTPDYASTGALKGFRQGPKDDLECLGYSLLELWMGDLPWYLTTDESAKEGWTPSNLRRMAEKREAMWNDLNARGEVPKFFVEWMDYVTGLEGFDVPDVGPLYDLISGLEATPTKEPFKEPKKQTPSKRKTLDTTGVCLKDGGPLKKPRAQELEAEE